MIINRLYYPHWHILKTIIYSHNLLLKNLSCHLGHQSDISVKKKKAQTIKYTRIYILKISSLTYHMASSFIIHLGIILESSFLLPFRFFSYFILIIAIARLFFFGTSRSVVTTGASSRAFSTA